MENQQGELRAEAGETGDRTPEQEQEIICHISFDIFHLSFRKTSDLMSVVFQFEPTQQIKASGALRALGFLRSQC